MDLKDEIQRWHREEEAKKERELSVRIRALNKMMFGGNFAEKILEAMGVARSEELRKWLQDSDARDVQKNETPY